MLRFGSAQRDKWDCFQLAIRVINGKAMERENGDQLPKEFEKLNNQIDSMRADLLEAKRLLHEINQDIKAVRKKTWLKRLICRAKNLFAKTGK